MKILGANHVVDILEELFEINEELGLITRYVVIKEEEKYSLNDLIKVW